MNRVNYKMFESKEKYEIYWSKVVREDKKMNVSELHLRTAKEILAICNQTDAVPVDIRSILETLEISAIPFDFTEVEESLPEKYKGSKILGAMISKDENAAILYSAKDKKDSHRMRFTIAHELAHICRGEHRHIEFRIDGDLTEDEIAANTFAGELLIPENTLKSVIKELLAPTIANLADIFDVSVNVMNERIKHLDLQDRVIGA